MLLRGSKNAPMAPQEIREATAMLGLELFLIWCLGASSASQLGGGTAITASVENGRRPHPRF